MERMVGQRTTIVDRTLHTHRTRISMTNRRRTPRRVRRQSNPETLRSRTSTRTSVPDGARDRDNPWFSRMIALSNGVFAISLTLLVLNLGIPAGTSSTDFGQSIIDLIPNLIAFALTVFIVVLYWYNHNALFESLYGIDMPMVGLGVIYLALIALIPFPNELLGNYPTEQLSYAIFATLLTGLSTVDTSMLAYAQRRGLTDPRIPVETHRIDILRGSATIATFGVSVPLSFVLVQWTPVFWVLLLVFDRILSRERE